MTEEKSCGMTCPLTGCPIKQVIIATLIMFAVTFASDFVFHGIYMKDAYEATAGMWRSEAEMQGLFHICLIYHGVLAFGVAALYCLLSKHAACGGTCHKTGLKFGFLVGLIIGISHFASYLWMPIPMEMALNWLGGTIIWGLLVGLALSFTCRICNKNKAS